MKPCPECNSDNLFQYKKEIDTSTLGGGLLPKLDINLFKSGRLKSVICGDCGYIRFFSTPGVLAKLENSKHWAKI